MMLVVRIDSDRILTASFYYLDLVAESHLPYSVLVIQEIVADVCFKEPVIKAEHMFEVILHVMCELTTLATDVYAILEVLDIRLDLGIGWLHVIVRAVTLIALAPYAIDVPSRIYFALPNFGLNWPF
jgi:hypothetical protein